MDKQLNAAEVTEWEAQLAEDEEFQRWVEEFQDTAIEAQIKEDANG